MGSSILDMSLYAERWFWLLVAGIIILGSFIAGGYPAMVVASFKSTWILKGKLLRSVRGIMLRRLLVGSQFAISIGLIAGTIVVFNQVSFMKNTDLGYQKDQLLIIKTPSVFDSTIFNKNVVFRNELLRDHNINHMTLVSDIPGKLVPLVNGVRIKGEDFQENINSYFISVKQDFVETMGLKLIAGRTFREHESSNPYMDAVNPVLLNELAVRRMGIKNPEDAVNKLITYKFGPIERTGEIIGVVNNYHQRSLKDDYDALLFYSTPFYDSHFYVLNVNTSDIRQTVKVIENSYEGIFPGHPFEYFFLDDYFNKQYAADQQFGKVFGMFSIIAIIVACLGLYGLAAFMIAQRIKEIAIRKVMGASVSGMIMLLSRDFIRLILLANLVALPVIYYYAKSWLNNFTFHIHIGWTMFVLPTVLLLIVSFFATSSQTIKTAFVNPSRTLKYE